jgi:hypothetical protein
MPDCGWDIPVEFAGPTTIDLAADGNDAIAIDVEDSAIDAAIKKAVESTFPKRTPK